MSKRKIMIYHLLVGLVKKLVLYKISHFPEPYIVIKNINDNQGWFSSLKIRNDKLDIDKLESTLVYLGKLSDVLKREVVKKDCI